MLIEHLVVCSYSLSHIHPQLYILLFPKLGGQCYQATDLCICQRYIVLLWYQTKNVPLLCPSCFFLPQRKSCTIWCGGKKKHISFMEGGVGAFPLRSQSADLLYLRKKKRNNFIGSRCWHCVGLLKMERAHSIVAVTKGYWWLSRFLWWVTFPAVRGQQKLHETQNEVSLWCQRARNTKD